jgi:uncharacterized protein (DUF1015 family)
LHELWVISSPEDIKAITQNFEQISSLYIADGHHRTASSYQLYQKNKTASYRYFLSYFVSDKYLSIKGFNRLIQLPISEQKFEQELAKYFECLKLKSFTQKGMKMYFKGAWCLLKPKKKQSGLDVELFTDVILKDILNVKDIRNIPFVKYIPNHQDYQQIQDDVAKHKCQVAFVIDPAKVSDIFSYSDQQKSLPPKTTWVEPKLRSALLMYEYK